MPWLKRYRFNRAPENAAIFTQLHRNSHRFLRVFRVLRVQAHREPNEIEIQTASSNAVCRLSRYSTGDWNFAAFLFSKPSDSE